MKTLTLRVSGLLGLAMSTAVCLMPAFAQAPTPYAKINAAAAVDPIEVKSLRGGISVLDGSGGNRGVLAGSDGLLMVDAGIAVSEQKLDAALERLKPGAVSYLINTHWHWDHTDGNGWVHKRGGVIIAHPNTAKHLGETIRVEEWGHTFTPVAADARPTVMVPAEKRMQFDGDIVVMRHYGPAHTDGDLSVYFTKADVLITGDTWWNGLYPFIDYVAGGSIDGMIKASNANIEMVSEHTQVVPGHGPVGGRADLVEYRDMLVAIRNRVAELKHQGKSLQQVIAAKPTAPFDAKWGQAIISPDLFTALVYRGV